MNFYFCETCGKRITDTDIQSGAGRNKKLNGVFCKQCAVGVLTMEIQAVNAVEPPMQQRIQTPPPSPAHALPSTATRLKRESKIRMADKAATSHGVKGPRQNLPPLFIIAGGASAILLIGIAIRISTHDEVKKPLAFAGSSTPPTAPAKTAEKLPLDPVKAAPLSASETRPPLENPVPSQPAKLPAVVPEPAPRLEPSAPASPSLPGPDEKPLAPSTPLAESKTVDTPGPVANNSHPDTSHPEIRGTAAREPVDFDFQSAESATQFQKLFSTNASFGMQLHSEQGKLVVRKMASKSSAGLGIAAPTTSLGRNFEILYQVNMRTAAPEIAGEKKERRSVNVHIRFLDPGEKFADNFVDGVRFALHLGSPSNGDFGAAMLYRNQSFSNFDNSKASGFFSNIAKNGEYVKEVFKGATPKKPANAASEFVVKFTVQNEHLLVLVNGMEEENTPLSPEAMAFFEKSPLALAFSVGGDASEIWLEHYSYRPLDKK